MVSQTACRKYSHNGHQQREQARGLLTALGENDIHRLFI
jgi:hypothetical protein